METENECIGPSPGRKGEYLAPIPSSWFFLHISVCGGCGKDRLSSTNLIIQLVSVIELDAQTFGKGMSKLGRGHLDDWSCRRLTVKPW
jgi:hypothetical protein